DHQLAKNTQRFFNAAGHDLICYTDPQQAVMAADKQRPDIIILDIFLAGRSGIEFLYELRSYPDWQGIPVIITGHLPADQLAVFRPSFDELNVAAYVPRQLSG